MVTCLLHKSTPLWRDVVALSTVSTVILALLEKTSVFLFCYLAAITHQDLSTADLLTPSE